MPLSIKRILFGKPKSKTLYNVYFVGGYTNRAFKSSRFRVVTDEDIADIVVFSCGEDLSPSLYKQRNTGQSYNNPMRDVKELASYRKAKNSGAVCVGICRGAQLLNVLNGGSMVQHIEDNRHFRSHKARVVGTNEDFTVPSDHHQLIVIPTATDAPVTVAVEAFDGDPEVFWFEQTRSIGFQYRPEAALGSDASRLFETAVLNFTDEMMKEEE